MLKRTGYLCVGAFLVGLFFVPTNRAADEARPSTQGFITGPAAEAWQHWEAHEPDAGSLINRMA